MNPEGEATGREQRTEVRSMLTEGWFMVVRDGAVIGQVVKLPNLRASHRGRRREKWTVVGHSGEFRNQGDAVAHLVRTHQGPPL